MKQISAKIQKAKDSEALFFKGRPGDPRIGEWVERIESVPPKEKHKESFILMGSPDDSGVVNNRGRAGAKEGPDSIRKHLYKMTLPMDLEWEKQIVLRDLGNIEVTNNILETHARAQAFTHAIAAGGHTIIALGGGHDFAAPHFLGFAQGTRIQFPKAKFALLNIDPHLDVRELENQIPNSGTAFRQILESGLLQGNHLVAFGTRANRNSRANYQYALSKKVRIDTLEKIREGEKSVSHCFQSRLKSYPKPFLHLGVTIDMDSCQEAEGTSAAATLGFTASELNSIAHAAGSCKAVRYFELAEVAPKLDIAERSSRIAAELIYTFLRARALSR